MTKIVINQEYGGFCLSEAQQKICNVDSTFSNVDRTLPALVASVEAGDTTDGFRISKLAVVEIPDNAYYIIREYDGYENVYWSMSEIHCI